VRSVGSARESMVMVFRAGRSFADAAKVHLLLCRG
jgi:hypothetical protein